MFAKLRQLGIRGQRFSGIKTNHIYLQIIVWVLTPSLRWQLGHRDVKLAYGNIQLHYDGVSLNHVCHPIWVTPNPFRLDFLKEYLQSHLPSDLADASS
ncbi:hypothetical protein H5410_042046, partial [Solanum commersonii]